VLFRSPSHEQLGVELLVNGLPVRTLEISGLKSGTMTPIRWPVYPWRGKVGVLRLVDRSRDGYLALDRVASRRWKHRQVFEDFESGRYEDRWQTTFTGTPDSYLIVARRLGLDFVLGKASALSLGRTGDQRLVSRPFVVDHDRIAFEVFDFGARNMQVRLLVDDHPVGVFRGKRSRRLVDVLWNVARFRGQKAVLEVVDGSPGEAWIGIDDVVFYDE